MPVVCYLTSPRQTEVPCGNRASPAINWNKEWPLEIDRGLVASVSVWFRTHILGACQLCPI